MLKAGTKAPRFTAQNQDGNTVRLEDFIGKRNVVLYFFPKDSTPG
jgi:peroxiredoxin Q/BCP